MIVFISSYMLYLSIFTGLQYAPLCSRINATFCSHLSLSFAGKEPGIHYERLARYISLNLSMTLTVISLFARSSAHIHASLQFKADTIHGGKDGAAQEPGMNDLIAVRCIPWYSLQFELITSWLLLPFILYTLRPCLACPSAHILPARRGIKLTLTAVMKACFT